MLLPFIPGKQPQEIMETGQQRVGMMIREKSREINATYITDQRWGPS